MVSSMTVIARTDKGSAALLSFLVATPALLSVVLALLVPAWTWLWLALALLAGLLPLVALVWHWRNALSRRGRWLMVLLLLIIPLLPLPAGLLLLALLRSLLPLRLSWRMEPPVARLLPAGYPWVDGALLAAIPLALLAI